MNTAILNKPIIALLIIGFLILSLSLVAESSLASSSPSAQQEQKAVDLLVRDLGFSTKTLSRDIRTYSWFSQKYFSGSIAHSYGNYTAPGMDGSKEFWKMQSNQQGNIGPGLYAAYDPTTSESYGNGYELDDNNNYIKNADGSYKRTFDYAALIEVVIQKGTAFVDVRGGINMNSFSISKEALKEINPHCGNKFTSNINAPSMFYKMHEGKKLEFRPVTKQSISDTKNCHRFLAKAFDQLKARFVAYGWGNESNRIRKTCDPGPLTAVVLTPKIEGSIDSIDFSNMANYSLKPDGMVLTVFARKLGQKPSAEKTQAYQLINDYSMFTRVGPGSTLGGKPPLASWREFDSHKYDETEMVDLVRTTRFGCDLKSYPEDTVPFFENNLNRE